MSQAASRTRTFRTGTVTSFASARTSRSCSSEIRSTSKTARCTVCRSSSDAKKFDERFLEDFEQSRTFFLVFYCRKIDEIVAVRLAMPKRFGLGDGSAYVDKNFSWSVCDVSARWTPARTPGPAGESAQHPVPPEEELAVSAELVSFTLVIFFCFQAFFRVSTFRTLV